MTRLGWLINNLIAGINALFAPSPFDGEKEWTKRANEQVRFYLASHPLRLEVGDEGE